MRLPGPARFAEHLSHGLAHDAAEVCCFPLGQAVEAGSDRGMPPGKIRGGGASGRAFLQATARRSRASGAAIVARAGGRRPLGQAIWPSRRASGRWRPNQCRRWSRRARPAHRARPHRQCRRRTRGRTEANTCGSSLPPLHSRRRIAPAVLGARGAGTRRPALATRRARRPSRAVPTSVARAPSCPRPGCSSALSTLGEPNRELLPTGRRRPAAEFRRSARKGR